MKRNYFKLLRKSFNGALVLGALGAMVAFSPKKAGNLPPAANGAFFFDPSNYVTFTVSGFNEDVIGNGNSTTGAVSSTTASVDNNNYCYLEMGSVFTSSGSATTYGLPSDGVLTSPNIDGLTFQLADYSGNNSLRINGTTDTSDHTLTFAETGSYETLYFAVTAGNGPSPVSGTINFDDNTTQEFTASVPDWFSSNALPVLIQGIGRVSRTTVSNPEFSSGNPRIYQLAIDVDLANQSKTVTGITIANSSTGTSNIFAASGKLAADCPGPTNVTEGAITAYEATFSWDAYDVTETYEVAVVEAGEDMPTTGTAVSATTYTFTELIPETDYEFYVRTTCTTSGYSYWAGPYSFTTAIACPMPTNVTVSGITTTEAVISWTEGVTGQTDFEVAIVETGDDMPTTGTAVTGTLYSTNTLTSATTYDVYVRANCDVDGFSSWTQVTSFNTACDPVTELAEDFEGSTALPICWSIFNGGDNNAWYVNTFNGRNGGNCMAIGYSSTAHNDYLITPALEVTSHMNDIISFWAKNSSSTFIDEFNVLVSTTGTDEADFTDVLASNVAPPTAYTEYTYDLSAYDGQTIYFAIQAISTDELNLYVDDLMTSGMPYCAAPTNLMADLNTLSWTDADSSSWEIVVQDEGTGEPTGNGEEVTSTSYDYTLPYGTVKEFYVRSLCDDGVNYSPWAGPFVFSGYQVLEIASGLSDDVIANGIGASATSTTNDIDGVNYAYLSRDFKETATDANLSYGLPVDGALSSPNIVGLHYQLADYSANNSLRMDTDGAGGTLTFANMQPAENIYLLVVAGSGPGGMAGTINFTDGTTQTIGTTNIPNWFNSNDLPVVISGIGRINVTNDNLENPNDNPRIYELTIAIDAANQSKTISSIDLQKSGTDEGVVNVFGASIKYSSYALGTNVIEATTIAVYPNPVKNNLYVQGVVATGVEVYNMLGQQMNVVLTNNTINMSGLDNGIYLVTIHSDNGDKTMRVVKN